MSYDLNQTIETLAETFTSRFPIERKRARTIGREAEYPVVSGDGKAGDVRRLWPLLMAMADLEPVYDKIGESQHSNLIVGLDGEDFSYALEVGWGTVEINTRPCIDLYTLQAIQERAVALLVKAASQLGYHVLGYGIQPYSPPSLTLMSPKQRYHSLYRAMGKAWLWYTVTASDQIHIDICRSEMVHLLNFGNLIAPILIALCANSPVVSGRRTPYYSAREGEMAHIYTHEQRHGVPRQPFDSIVEFVQRISQTTYLIVKDSGEVIPSSRPFTDYLHEHGPDFAAFMFHEHYMWNSARLRAAYGTIEIRPACQQPWEEHMAAMALSLGLIEASEPILDYIQTTLGEDYWQHMLTFHQQAIRFGLVAPQPASQFLTTIVHLASEGLLRRGYGEERLLQPLFTRLERSMNPAQRVARFFDSGGLSQLLTETRIRDNFTRSTTRANSPT